MFSVVTSLAHIPRTLVCANMKRACAAAAGFDEETTSSTSVLSTMLTGLISTLFGYSSTTIITPNTNNNNNGVGVGTRRHDHGDGGGDRGSGGGALPLSCNLEWWNEAPLQFALADLRNQQHAQRLWLEQRAAAAVSGGGCSKPLSGDVRVGRERRGGRGGGGGVLEGREENISDGHDALDDDGGGAAAAARWCPPAFTLPPMPPVLVGVLKRVLLQLLTPQPIQYARPAQFNPDEEEEKSVWSHNLTMLPILLFIVDIFEYLFTVCIAELAGFVVGINYVVLAVR